MTAEPLGANALLLRPAPSLLPPARSRRHLQVVDDNQPVLAVGFRATEYDPHFGPQRTPSHDLPDPAAWGQRLILGLLETLSGLRPPSQVERWMTLELRERVQRTHAMAVRRGARPASPARVLRVRACEAVEGAAEVSAVVHDRGRVRAAAMRLVACDGRWLLTDLEIG